MEEAVCLWPDERRQSIENLIDSGDTAGIGLGHGLGFGFGRAALRKGTLALDVSQEAVQ